MIFPLTSINNIYIYNAIVNWSHRCTQHIHSKSKYYIYIYCIKYHDILWLLMVIIPFLLHHQFPPCFHHDFATHVTTRFWPARRWVSSLPSWVLTSSRRWNAGFHQAKCWVLGELLGNAGKRWVKYAGKRWVKYAGKC
jgi:hypothetical protein